MYIRIIIGCCNHFCNQWHLPYDSNNHRINPLSRSRKSGAQAELLFLQRELFWGPPTAICFSVECWGEAYESHLTIGKSTS